MSDQPNPPSKVDAIRAPWSPQRKGWRKVGSNWLRPATDRPPGNHLVSATLHAFEHHMEVVDLREDIRTLLGLLDRCRGHAHHWQRLAAESDVSPAKRAMLKACAADLLADLTATLAPGKP